MQIEARERAAESKGRHLTQALRLLRSRSVETGDILAGLREICECANRALLAERTTIWNAAGDGSRLYCMNRLVSASDLHSAGGEVRERDIPELCAELRALRVVAVSSARSAPILRGFFAPASDPFDLAVLAVPVALSGRWVGAIIVERIDVSMDWSQDQEEFCLGLADVLSRSMEATLRTRVETIHAVAGRAQLLQEMSVRASVEADLRSHKLNVERELQLGAAIQAGINVSDLTPWNGISFAKVYLPMETISGDYLDILRRADSLHMLVADVSGHGIPAAFWTMMAKQVFVESIHKSVGPANAYDMINEALVQRIHTADYLTSAMVRVDSHNNLNFCLAGHPSIIHIDMHKRTARYLDGAGFVLGVAHPTPIPFFTGSLKLNSGDRVILYTDGIIEQTNAQGEQFGTERLLEAVITYFDEPLPMLVDRLSFALAEFMHDVNARDDISILALELSPHWGAFVKLSNEGMNAMKLGQFMEAVDKLQSAHLLIPTYPETILALAKGHLKLGNVTEAETYIEAYRKAKPSCIRGLNLAGKVYIKLANTKSLEVIVAKLKVLAALDQRAAQLEKRIRHEIAALSACVDS